MSLIYFIRQGTPEVAPITVFPEQLFNDMLARYYLIQHGGPSFVPIGNTALYVIRGTCPKCGKRRLKRNRCVLSRCRKCKWKPIPRKESS